MIKLRRMTADYLAQIDTLTVHAEQVRFVGTMEDILVNVDACTHPHCIVENERVVGFFLIDTTYGYAFDFAPEGCLGLRAFFISELFQGRGYGKQAVALLPEYLHHEYPTYSDLYFTVNCQNLVAIHCYQTDRICDTRQIYDGGPSGPQRIMRLTLKQG